MADLEAPQIRLFIYFIGDFNVDYTRVRVYHWKDKDNTDLKQDMT